MYCDFQNLHFPFTRFWVTTWSHTWEERPNMALGTTKKISQKRVLEVSRTPLHHLKDLLGENKLHLREVFGGAYPSLMGWVEHLSQAFLPNLCGQGKGTELRRQADIAREMTLGALGSWPYRQQRYQAGPVSRELVAVSEPRGKEPQVHPLHSLSERGSLSTGWAQKGRSRKGKETHCTKDRRTKSISRLAKPPTSSF